MNPKQIISSLLFLIILQFNCFSKDRETPVDIDTSIESTRTYKQDTTEFYIIAEEKLAEARKSKDDLSIARALFEKGRVYENHQGYNVAIESYESAIDYFEKVNVKDEIPELKRIIGRIYYEFADYTRALRYYIDGLRMCEELGIENSTKAWLLRYTGSVYKRQKKYPRALNYYSRAYELFVNLNDTDGMSSSLNNLGIVYLETNNDTLALQYYKKALVLAEKLEERERISIINDNLGILYRKRGDFDSSIFYFNRAFENLMSMKKTNHLHLASNYVERAILYIKINQLDLAEETLIKAHDHALKTKRKRKLRLSEIYETYATLYELKGNYKESLHYHNLYDSLRDFLHSAQVSAEVERIQFVHERDKYEQKGKAEKVLENQQYKNQRNWLIYFIVGFCGVLLFGVIIFIQKNKLSNAYQSLVAKNLEVVSSALRKTIKSDRSRDNDSEKYSKSALVEEQKEELLQKIIKAMENDKVFMDFTLSVGSLAGELSTNKTYVSQIINENYGKNFNAFVNEYRIKEARIMLASDEYRHLSIDGIAKSTGFKSISAFNTAFKKYTGLTPSYFLKSVKETN